MEQDKFREKLLGYFDELIERTATSQGDLSIKGFIDVYKRVYTISNDTKVLSKVFELLIFPVIVRFADEQGYKIILAKAQNQYPDISLVSIEDESVCYALDIKTTYRTKRDKDGKMRVNGMTLGTFGGYFRIRDRPLTSTFAYNRYLKHYVLGMVYSRVPDIDERKVYTVDELDDIPSVVTGFQFFLQEKYRIASDIPGSGNTKNIGSTKLEERLINGTGVFAKLGVEVFDDYWMNYRTARDGRQYSNLISYQAYKQQGTQILSVPTEEIETEAGISSEVREDDNE